MKGKELSIRREIKQSFRDQVAQLVENERYTLEISRLCFEESPLEDIIALFRMKCQCDSLILVSCRQVRSLFMECGKMTQPLTIGTLALVNPNQDGIDALSSELRKKLVLIHSLDINSSITPGIASCLAQTIDGTVLKSLDLSKCHWDRRSVDTLARSFAQATTLRCLDLSHCHLEDSLVARILYSLQNHPSLRELRISLNNCHTEGCASIGALLKTTQLERLEMAQQFIGRQKCLDINCIIGALSHNSSLQFLDLKENFLDSEHVENLLTSLSMNVTLQEIDLSCTDISDKSLSLLASRLNSTPIRRLSLYHNPFQNADPLVEAARQNYQLLCVGIDYSVSSRSKLCYYTALNRAGRSLMVDSHVPLSLWPFILQRASQTPFAENLELQSSDMLFYMIQGPAVI